ncbi:MAG: hypothetical protein LCH46_01270 [Proteobacteria bacterium]|nr:hypothetical protein [Pseudomonadota bacterium]
MTVERAEFRYSTAGAKVLYWIGIGVAVFFGLLAIYSLVRGEIGAALLFVAIGAAVAGYGFWYHNRVTTDRSVKLAIDGDGIFAPTAAAKPVPWAEVEKIVLVRGRPKKPGFMAIDVVDPAKYEPTRATAAMAKLNQALGGGELIIQYGELDGTLEDIRAAILKAHPGVQLVDK